MWETWVQSLVREDLLEKDRQSSLLNADNPRKEELLLFPFEDVEPETHGPRDLPDVTQ